MSKRAAGEDGESNTERSLKNRHRTSSGTHESSTNQSTYQPSDFEDDFSDEFSSEDEIFEAGVDGRPDAELEAEQKDAMELDQDTFIPGRHKLEAGQSLAPDATAYEMLHTLSLPWPCLSFGILRDDLGDARKTYPATVYAVAGTQAGTGRARENEILVMKMSSLSRMEKSRDEEDSEDDDSVDGEDGEGSAESILETKSIPMTSTTNRIRAHRFPQTDSLSSPKTMTAAMTEAGDLIIHDITPHLTFFDNPGSIVTPFQSQPLATLKHHGRNEGYAVAWSPLITTGKILSGDQSGKIFASSAADGNSGGGGKWTTDTKPYTGHTGSVEDIAWSPNERNVFASASADGTVKVWDIRSKSRKPAVDVQISNTDVNVLSWSKLTQHLLATGDDNGGWAVWDLRAWKPTSTPNNLPLKPESVASFSFHKEQITSIEWHPSDDSIVAVAAGDNTLTLWDLAVELDDEESRDTAGVADVPPQLLFVHYMEAVKECHWHSQIPGVVMATGMSGLG